MTNKEQTYAGAVTVLEELLQQMETGELDVDDLAEKVKQASQLLKFCREKLFSTEKELEKILKEMEEEEE